MFKLTISTISLLVISFSLIAQDFDALNDQAYTERSNKNYQKAIDLATQALNKKTNTRSYILRADCRYSLNDYLAALDDYNSALTYYSEYYGTDNKERAGIYYYLGRCKQKLQRYSEAISDFNSALSYNYDSPGYAYWNRGACSYDLGKYKDAEDDYIKAIDKISNSEDLSSLYEQRGDCQAMLGNYETAYSLYARAISYDSKNYNPYWQRGHYKGQEYKYEEALTDFNKAIDIINAGGSGASTNDLAILYRNKAIMLKSLKKYDEAITAISKSLETDPNMAKTYRIRAEIYDAMKKYDKAKADYENSITLQSDKKIKSDMYMDRSIMEWKVLDYKSCVDDLNKAIENDPEDGMNHWHLSIVYGYKKNYPLAVKECNTAMDLYKTDSSSTASLYWLRASHKERAGDFNGALEDYQTYLKYYPGSYSCYYELGRLFKTKMKNGDLADANLSKAADLSEKNYDTVKACYVKIIKGQKDDAIKTMLQVVQSTSTTNDYYYKWNLHNMACIYALAGNTIKAFEYLDKSLAAGYDDYLHLVNDRDLLILMTLPQWKAVLSKYKVPQPKL